MNDLVKNDVNSGDINTPHKIDNTTPFSFGGNYGWICPKCGRVYSPFTHMCPYCVPDSMNNITYTSTAINKI